MKKIIIALISGFYLFSTSASAEMGLNIGITGTGGIFGANAKETHTQDAGAPNSRSDEATEIAGVGYPSAFIEKEFADGRVAIGMEYVPVAFESETAETAKADMEPDATSRTVVTNSVQVDLEDLTTIYATVSLTEGLYVKAGIAAVEVITNESLTTGSSYGNTTLDGTVLGIGYNMDLDNGLFARVEGEYMSFDGVSLTANQNTITLKSLDGVSGKVSIGKSF